MYAGLRNFNEEYYNVSEVSTDEIIVPTRGTDWYDNGKWLDIHRQTWTANSPGALDNMNGAWTQLFNGVARANVVIDALQRRHLRDQARHRRRAAGPARALLLRAAGHVRRRADRLLG